MGYELLLARHHTPPELANDEEESPLATAEDMSRFYQHLELMLVEIGFLDPENPRKLMRRLHRLFNRTRMDQSELNILRGILKAVQTGPGRHFLDKNSEKLI
jgi:tRNA C32,U32 (ribose-2'-O)-methylase TrmJ